ncbi:unnamed protein product [Spodoptera exigua]|uniref:Uncharacterized protein n=1 Tax=Spodoptera exigua TaxID=7107 RepID=A0A922SIJ1_SPOEX|nr:hypothetical protein HF086_014480 [Spodoptera exigua]CAH0669012.1 unnamed protein product [Spodoptera exigua]
MKKTDVFRTLEQGERVTSIYAQTYLNDDYCKDKKSNEKSETPVKFQETGPEFEETSADDEWISPSDLLIGVVDLKPPFTSKITRGITHQGILNIGDGVLKKERDRFLEHMRNVISENDVAWNQILEHEKSSVAKKVKETYHKILMEKSKILMKEINIFYEQSLQELEDHLQTEIQNVLVTAHANIISDLNFEIRDKLKKEKLILEDVLQKRFDSEVKKITHYYKLLLDNEIYRNQKLVNQAIIERNEALKAFYKQIEAQNITSTMYVMCTERKKCKIRKFLLENIHSTEIAEKLQKIKERQEIIDSFKSKERKISDINKEWETKIKKILKLFLKFVSFSLKLLPEQTTFLLDLEKMVVLQLNEMQKAPMNNTSILIDTDEQNILQFEQPKKEDVVCDKEPFVIEGDLNDPVPPQYGSRETLASDVDLPYIRLQRKFVYAKCGKMDEVRAFLESQRCKCQDPAPDSESPDVEEETTAAEGAEVVDEAKSESSSYEPLLLDDFEILKNCPARKCQDWVKKYSFPWLVSYLDFSEENYEKVKTILGKLPDQDPIPELINPKDMINQELPFAATKEPYRNVGTQYSSQEDVSINFTCPCMGDEGKNVKITESEPKVTIAESQEIKDIVLQRQQSLQRLLKDHPRLLKLFTDEGYDFVYPVK